MRARGAAGAGAAARSLRRPRRRRLAAPRRLAADGTMPNLAALARDGRLRAHRRAILGDYRRLAETMGATLVIASAHGFDWDGAPLTRPSATLSPRRGERGLQAADSAPRHRYLSDAARSPRHAVRRRRLPPRSLTSPAPPSWRRTTPWRAIASYIYSKLEGNYDGEYAPFTNVGADPNISAMYDYYDFFTNGKDLSKITNTGPLS